MFADIAQYVSMKKQMLADVVLGKRASSCREQMAVRTHGVFTDCGNASCIFAQKRAGGACSHSFCPPGNNGYPESPLTDCVAPVAPEDWLATYTNTIEQV